MRECTPSSAQASLSASKSGCAYLRLSSGPSEPEAVSADSSLRRCKTRAQRCRCSAWNLRTGGMATQIRGRRDGFPSPGDGLRSCRHSAYLPNCAGAARSIQIVPALAVKSCQHCRITGPGCPASGRSRRREQHGARRRDRRGALRMSA